LCGIAGIYSKSGFDPLILSGFSEKIRHRGPDDEGYYLFDGSTSVFASGEDTIPELKHLADPESCGISPVLGFLHRRLSIIDLSPGGHQPMSFADDSLVIVFNGEIYNFIELREELKSHGFMFNTASDTEVVLAAYRHWGAECVKRFIGMWSFCIHDKRKDLLFFSRDRYGIKPFYYHSGKSGFLFGSEIKLFFSWPGITPETDIRKTIEFITTGRLNFGEETLFRDIRELPPAHNMVLRHSDPQPEISRYYTPGEGEKPRVSNVGEAAEQFSGLFTNAVKLHLRSDVPVGSCLSGGLDSSLLFSVMAKQALPYPLNSFTAVYPGEDIDEAGFVEKFRKLISFNDFYTQPSADVLWGELNRLTWHQDLPMNTSSPYAQWEVMKLAGKNGIKVLLDGQGADEILGGYSEFTGAFLLNYLFRLKLLKFFRNLRHLKANYATSGLANGLFRAGFHYMPRPVKYALYSRERIAPSFIHSDYRNLAKQIPFSRRIAASVRETSLSSLHHSLVTLLRYEDRNSMAFSIESRVPFLDHRLVEFCLNMPDDLKIHEGWTKYVIREAGRNDLPPEVTWRRKKLGFATPESKWQAQLGQRIAEYAGDARIPEFLDRTSVLKAIGHPSANPVNAGELWRLVLFLKWCEVFSVTFSRA
jgi:asparagine synthase (glutamine-hydrolysing)